MIQAPLNSIIVKVASLSLGGPNRFLKEDVMNPSSRVSPADFVQIVGDVVSIPKKISDRMDYKGYSTADIRPGDVAIFSYQVIFNYAVTTNEEVLFKNRFYYKAEEYFLADIQQIYAVIRDGQIRMQNGFVMLAATQTPPLILLSPETKKLNSTAHSAVTHIGRCLTTEKPIGVMPGDVVYFNPNKLQTYTLNEKSFGIIRQSHILGKKIPDYKNFASMY